MVKVISHPLIKVKLSRMRNKDTDSRDFRTNLQELAMFMAYEVTKDLEVEPLPIETPIAKTTGYRLKKPLVLVPILRAGLGMVDGFKSLVPAACIGHIGLYRQEDTLEIVQYYCKMPENIKDANVIILDPMLATGKSSSKAIEIIKSYHPKSIKFASIVAAPEGVSYLEKLHPEIDCYTAAIDDRLNEKGYIVPGLGDAGDRIFGTK